MKRFFALVLSCAFVGSTGAFADEGMWLYNEAPKDKIKSKYGLTSMPVSQRKGCLARRAV